MLIVVRTQMKQAVWAIVPMEESLNLRTEELQFDDELSVRQLASNGKTASSNNTCLVMYTLPG